MVTTAGQLHEQLLAGHESAMLMRWIKIQVLLEDRGLTHTLQRGLECRIARGPAQVSGILGPCQEMASIHVPG